ncbi:6,7-dimethyl-8-ribityllumazine synthase [Acuticoccus sp. MNP-M23]|uniref:6,7-dimethyl-8-ribityllumazine synthase n=1 Tax=Acuticoccus sp. MNP-M23 TaxID=3072793 RepID=UPI0028150F05|nr:6,7-dimethyl-8-ribityllumazine synthase [Acuticoccus sp. MNP-M23]WMS43352.1 6,7-dimethyl-8-ribityllumazine synthase [Acuticoccus sp. MNP-M23]
MARALIIEARFYDDIGDMLLAGATAELKRRKFAHEVISVPGVLEIPPALAMAIASSRRRDLTFDAFVVLGCVIRGETGHYDIVAGEGNRAIMDLVVGGRLALGNGILTVENREQAIVRADPNQKDKGGDAAAAAIALFDLRNALT